MRRAVVDSATALLRALGARFESFDGAFRVEELSSRCWASVTFSGARHRIVFSLAGVDAGATADSFVERLDETDFDLRGHILADVALLDAERDGAGERVKLTIEALTVEDD
jgi:hypothetical protein